MHRHSLHIKSSFLLLATACLLQAAPADDVTTNVQGRGSGIAFVLPQSAGLQDYLRFAEANNPALQASQHAWQAAQQQEHISGSLPDARLSFSHFIRQVETRVGPQNRRFGLQQAVPWPGNLGLARSAARAQAGAMGLRHKAKIQLLHQNLKKTWAELYLAGRTVAIAQKNLQLLDRIEQTSRAAYQVGRNGYAALLRSQVELAKGQDMLESRQSNISALTAVFNLHLGRVPRQHVNLPHTLPLPDEAGLPSADSLAVLLTRHNPSLAALRRQVVAAGHGQRLASRSGRPNFTFGLDLIQTGEAASGMPPGNGKDPVIASVALNLPLGRAKYHAQGRKAAGHLAELEQGLANERNSLLARLQVALVKLEDARRRAVLYGQALEPKASQAVGAALGALAAGTATYTEVAEGQRTLLEFRLELERSKVQVFSLWAELEMLCGVALSEDL